MASDLIFATRPSSLARWQTTSVIRELRRHWQDIDFQEVIITTQGDRNLDSALPEIGGKGLFTQELESALLAGRVHAAVHSLKDLPTEIVPELEIAALPVRAEPGDVLISPSGLTLEELPAGAIVGTSSNRRRAQILAYRPDLEIKPIRGNIDTRIRKVQAGGYDAIILAAAGVIRLGLQKHISQCLPMEIMLPAPGQGALAVQCRSGDEQAIRLLQVIDHIDTALAVSAERAFLSALGGGCSLPVGALAQVDGGVITLQGVVVSLDGKHLLRLSSSGRDPIMVGNSLAQDFLDRGFMEYINLAAMGSE
ncbi:MAG: hydroxymethylbilane synthase [Anaerolineales bacterium]|nr:hydroxymethylbilane synthase [Anaerolineales bacterium]